MARGILAAILIFTVACQARDHKSLALTVPGSFYSDEHMHHSNCADQQGSISLEFINVGLCRLHSYFTSSPNLSCLSFENNEITQVSPLTFDLMPNLLYLSLARNRLDFANFSQLAGHPNLRTLVLDENRDTDLVEGPILQLDNEFPRLLFLHAHNCSFRDVTSLAFAPRLMHLYLSSNDLATSNMQFLKEAVKYLRILDLADNGLYQFDAGKLYGLSHLRLDDNKFDRLCATLACDSGSVLALGGATKLERLSLARNAIAHIELSAFDYALNLTHLDLSDNRIQNIDNRVFGKLPNLVSLSLKGNLLTEVPYIHALTRLQHLSLASNNLKVVTKGIFSDNKYVKTLNLSNNNIATVEPDAFRWQHYLESLDLSSNKLNKFTNNWLSNMNNLKVLYVNNNLFTTLDNLYLGRLPKPSTLREIYLQNNQITKFYSRSFNYHVLDRIADLAFVLFDSANSTVTKKNAEKCKCDCSGNDIDSSII